MEPSTIPYQRHTTGSKRSASREERRKLIAERTKAGAGLPTVIHQILSGLKVRYGSGTNAIQHIIHKSRAS